MIGGASVYAALLDCCDTAYVTKVHRAFPADCCFPNLDRHPEWRIAEEGPVQREGEIEFHRVTYMRSSFTG